MQIPADSVTDIFFHYIKASVLAESLDSVRDVAYSVSGSCDFYGFIKAFFGDFKKFFHGIIECLPPADSEGRCVVAVPAVKLRAYINRNYIAVSEDFFLGRDSVNQFVVD
jgi:hypothetical protein